MDALSFSDVILVPQHSKIYSRLDTDLTTYATKHIQITHPIISTNMVSVTEVGMAKEMARLGSFGILHRFLPEEKLLSSVSEIRSCFPASVSIGVKREDYPLVDKILDIGINILLIDVAHGDCDAVINMIRYLQDKHVSIAAGNVATAEGAKRLLDEGIDALRLGIGGSCFAAGTKVLMASGLYKNIEDVNVDDLVINKNGVPVKVVKSGCTGIKKVIKYKHTGWHDYTICTPDHLHYSINLEGLNPATLISHGYKYYGKERTKWSAINQKQVLLCPNTIQLEGQDKLLIDLKDYAIKQSYLTYNTKLVNSYALGYLFGTFIGDGSAVVAEYNKSKRGAVHWYFGKQEKDIANKLVNFIYELTGLTATIKEGSNMLSVSLYNKPFAHLFLKFGKKQDKHLPDEFMCTDRDYLLGIFDGLKDSDGWEENGRLCFCNISIKAIELFNSLCLFLHKATAEVTNRGIRGNATIQGKYDEYSARLVSNIKNRTYEDMFITKILDYQSLELEVPVYDIEVDCPTHSFIANNVIVHNSVCSTRYITGHGMPTLQSIMDCAPVCKSYGVPIWADGGFKTSGDIVKALAAGASCVTLGSLLAATSEAAGDWENGFKKHMGSSSKEAQELYRDGLKKGVAAEGIEKLVPFQGTTEEVVATLLGGIRSGLTYSGARTIAELQEKAIFRKLSYGAIIESKYI